MKKRKKSRMQEARTAKQFKGKVQPGSGCIDGLKGDVRTGITSISFNEFDFLIENKYTNSDKYSLKVSVWKKIAKEALKDNLRIPLMQIDLCPVGKTPVSYIVMDYDNFAEIGGIEYWKFDASNYITVEKAKSYLLEWDDKLFRKDIFLVSCKLRLVVIMLNEFLSFLKKFDI